MDNKKQIICTIQNIMKENNISLDDLKQETQTKDVGQAVEKAISFDLLCDWNGRLCRLPFNHGRNFNPIAIFPFKDADVYWLFQECNNKQRSQIHKHRLPSVGMFERMFSIKDELNKALAKLHQPLWKPGVYYYAINNWNNVTENYIVGYKPSDDHIFCDHFPDDEIAIARYVGYYR